MKRTVMREKSLSQIMNRHLASLVAPSGSLAFTTPAPPRGGVAHGHLPLNGSFFSFFF